jgi:hypothetical protein
MSNNKILHEEWRARGRELFGDDPLQWKFVCPSCGNIASVADWKAAGASEGEVAYSCIGRRLGTENEIGSKKQPCNYAGGGLFGLNPVTVIFPDGTERASFAFAGDA